MKKGEETQTVGLLYICTGLYKVFWKDFYESYEKNFLPELEKHYIVFTDADELLYSDRDNVHIFYQKKLGWPYDTMMRFDIFEKQVDFLKKYDYLFFMNANCICNKEVHADEFLPTDRKLLVVRHPGFYNKGPFEFPYDRNKKSKAYIPKGEGKIYVCGGVNGGVAEDYLILIKKLNRMVASDLSNKVIPLWHDESIINKYVFKNPNEFEIKESDYCYPEGWNIPFEDKIIVRDKSKWIDVEGVKGSNKRKSIIQFISSIISNARR